MPPRKAIKHLPFQGKLNTFFNLNKHVSTVNDVKNNNDKNTNNDQSQSEAGAEHYGSETHEKPMKIFMGFSWHFHGIFTAFSWLKFHGFFMGFTP